MTKHLASIHDYIPNRNVEIDTAADLFRLNVWRQPVKPGDPAKFTARFGDHASNMITQIVIEDPKELAHYRTMKLSDILCGWRIVMLNYPDVREAPLTLEEVDRMCALCGWPAIRYQSSSTPILLVVDSKYIQGMLSTPIKIEGTGLENANTTFPLGLKPYDTSWITDYT